MTFSVRGRRRRQSIKNWSKKRSNEKGLSSPHHTRKMQGWTKKGFQISVARWKKARHYTLLVNLICVNYTYKSIKVDKNSRVNIQIL
jgi:hypothetical protein